jgi:hypothetical protein
MSALASTSLAGGNPPFTIHSNGYGPVEIGMTVKQAAKALGEALQRSFPAYPFEEDCLYVYPQGDDTSIGFMVRDDVITRIDVWDSSIATKSGLTVGASEEGIQKRFKSKVTVDEHEYLGSGGHYVTVNVFGGNQLLFVTEAKNVTELPNGELKDEDFRVTRYRVGRPSSVSLVEGCL